MMYAALNRFLHWMVVGLASPVLVLLIVSKGVPLERAGFILAILSAAVVACEVPSGMLSDRLGRKRVYLGSLALFFVSVCAILASDGFAALAAGFALFGVARAFSSGSIEADFVDRRLEEKGEAGLPLLMTALGVGETLGLALGALAGGFLPELWRNLFPLSNRYAGNLLAMLAVLAALFVLSAAGHRARPAAPKESAADFIRGAADLLRRSGLLRRLLLGAAAWGFSFGALELYWQPRLQGLLGPGGDLLLFGALNGGCFLAAAAGTLGMGALLDRTGWRPLRAAFVLRLALGAVMAALALQGGALGFAFLFLLAMGFNGMLGVPEGAAFNAALPDSKRSSLLSVSSLAAQLGGIGANAGLALAFPLLGTGGAWAAAAAVFAVSALLYLRTDQR